MKVYVVVGVYGGCIDHVQAWAEGENAERDRTELEARYGIGTDYQGESEHVVRTYELELLPSD